MMLLAVLFFTALGFSAEAADDNITKVNLGKVDVTNLKELMSDKGSDTCKQVLGVCYLLESGFPNIEFNTMDAQASADGQNRSSQFVAASQQKQQKENISKIVGEMLNQLYPRVLKDIKAYPKFVLKHFAKQMSYPGAPFRFVIALEVAQFDEDNRQSDSNRIPPLEIQTVVFFGDYRFDNDKGASIAVDGWYPLAGKDTSGDPDDSNANRRVSLGKFDFMPPSPQWETIRRARAVETVLSISGNYIPNLFQMQSALSSADLH